MVQLQSQMDHKVELFAGSIKHVNEKTHHYNNLIKVRLHTNIAIDINWFTELHKTNLKNTTSNK